MAESSHPQPLHLIIRFTTSIPDLPLTIPTPSTTTTVTLKQQIRTYLPSPTSSNRLRLIHAGKVLPDNSVLISVLNLPSQQPTPPPSTPSNNDNAKANGKGKTPIRDPPQPEPLRVYIHCSIGDTLTASDLAEEAAAAADSSRAPTPSLQQALRSTTVAPRGFDRLLSAGFTPVEIAGLRSQFMALQSHAHTPDTMPSDAELRVLEDQWIDEAAGGGAASVETGEGLTEGGLEDMLIGNVIGFFWPLGAIFLLREEGVWSKRRQIAVFTGMLVNIAFSILRVTS
ncbi:MAG: hypothetical protein M1827_005062 [Pycnora praestabilis]|nr:MAG: hypothetical protein M1827_005062 [Pycnora praestabilis]